MPFDFHHHEVCPSCPYGGCAEDLRERPVRGRETQFRFRQKAATYCTFAQFVPGTDSDPIPSRSFAEYLGRFRSNALGAGLHLFGNAHSLSRAAIAKVEGDVFETLEAGALWAAAAAWNAYMETGVWSSEAFSPPTGAIAAPARKVAILQLPRGYDTTKLFESRVLTSIKAHEQALKLQGMELGLSSPDIVGVRLPDPLPAKLRCFMTPLPNLSATSLQLLKTAYRELEGSVTARGFLFAIAVKRTTRSDRLYQPLFEANVLKYLIEEVLRGSAFRFYAHLNSLAGADVVGHYRAASLISLLRGGNPSKAIDSVYVAERPRDSAQSILDDLRLFPM